MNDEKVQCPFCAEMINAEAVKCRFCGEFLDEDLRRERLQEQNPGVTTKFQPGLALVLGLIGTGFGQLYESRIGSAFGVWVAMGFLLLLGFAFAPPILLIAMIFHVVMAFEAYAYRPEDYLDEIPGNENGGW